MEFITAIVNNTDWGNILLLCCFSFLAGFIDAVSGGGGLIQLPALFILQPYLSLVQTLATNKTASFAGTAVAAMRYFKKINVDLKMLIPAIIAALFASFGGALLVSFVKKEQFMPFIITALVIVLLYTLFKKELGLNAVDKPRKKHLNTSLLIAVGGILGMYEGLIGPGTGSFLVFAFIIFFGLDFLHASASAKVINVTANIGALFFFVYQGYVVWDIAIPIALANMSGNYIGAHVAIKKGSGFVRWIFIIVSAALIVKLSYDYL